MLKVFLDSEQPLEEILAKAEEAEGPPPDPKGGIPRQWLPSVIRWPVRILLLPFILLDLTAQKIAKTIVRPPFKKQGKCLKRGNCCHYILLPESKGVLGKLFYFWSTQVLGFYPRSSELFESEGKKVRVMGCRYLKRDGSCLHYHLRPVVCRKWPLIEYFGIPRVIKGCGYRAVQSDRE